MSQPFKLFRLQQIDSQLDRKAARLREIETALSEDQALRRATAAKAEIEKQLERTRKDLKQAEQVVKDQRLKIEQTEATLYGGKVRNPKELQDLQNEAASLKRYRTVLEDRQLEVMIELEMLEEQHEQAEQQLEQVRTSLAEKHSDLNAEREDLLHEQERMRHERQAAASSIPEADMQLYEQLRKQRRGVAVARVSDRACSACGSTLSSGLLSAARSPSQLTRCDMCGRILYAG